VESTLTQNQSQDYVFRSRGWMWCCVWADAAAQRHVRAHARTYAGRQCQRADVNDMCVLALCHTISRRRVLRSVKVPVTCAPSSCENSMKDDICDTVSFVPKGSYPDFDGVGSFLSDPDTSLPRVVAEYFILFFYFYVFFCAAFLLHSQVQ
jgi:hypothetical protein